METISGAGLLTQIFGGWPTFHDAEVVRLELFRSDPGPDGPGLEADIHLFAVTSQLDPRGRYVLTKHTLATFVFHGVRDVEISGFNNQNVLMGLEIHDIRHEQLETLNFRVSFDAAFGVSAAFLCRAIEVREAKPWSPKARGLAV